ncbi:teichoic acid transport system permease protein [Actinomyces ruminicola]|uniref:Teichoic acid transport system permease protein n=1 Tax=Actinomyces ruminicola TaxID=332524 RepID=A0A1G9ZM20_9ACTO|nr:ABC transporter permease [Actinomyces ruminicola]SDN22165.1 teichoic acid transport system permease protein [Actinomyces ruminicola]
MSEHSHESFPMTWLDRAYEAYARSSHVVSVQQLQRLSPVGQRPRLGKYIAQLWQRRHFIWADARAKALGSQRGTLLGNAWLIVKPMLDSLVFFIIFGLLLQTSRGIENFIGYLIIGVTLFPPLQRAITGGAQVIQNGRNMIRGFSFPRAVLPISYTLRSAIDSLPPLLAVLLLVMALPPHALPTWHWVLIAPIFLLQFTFGLGLTFFTARITALLPDMRNIWPFLTQFWFYGSGVFFSYERFIDHPTMLAFMDVNPGYLILTMYRNCILYSTVPDARSWVMLIAWAFGTFALGFVFFWAKEVDYGLER